MVSNTDTSKLTLAVIGGRVSTKDGRLFALNSFAKIVEALADRYQQIFLSARLRPEDDIEDDYPLPSNVKLIPQPNWRSTLDSLRHLKEIRASYKEVIINADHVFVRGNPVAATRDLYSFCEQYSKPVCHWLVGNPMVLLGSHDRGSKLATILGQSYVWLWERQLLNGRKRTSGSFICNGQEIADRYPTEKTYVTVSTSLTKKDFFKREDTCQGDSIKILTLCYMRPEKGIEYLIEAFGKLKAENDFKLPVKLVLAGGRDRYSEYQNKLDKLISQYDLKNNVQWLGHVEHNDINRILQDADIFVLPSLSEGTPRVLIEARANSLPIIASNVGGVSTSVKDGLEGLLVASKNPEEISQALHKIITQKEIRKNLISNGYESVKNRTVDAFAAMVIENLVLDKVAN